MLEKLAILIISPSAMARNMLVRYRVQAATGSVHSHSPTVKSTPVFGRTILKVARANTLTKTGPPTKDNGRTTQRRATVLLAGPTVMSMKVSMKMVLCMVKESLHMPTEPFTRETFALTKFKVLVASSTGMEPSMSGTGSITRSMELVL